MKRKEVTLYDVTGVVNPADIRKYPGLSRICLICVNADKAAQDCKLGQKITEVQRRFEAEKRDVLLNALCGSFGYDGTDNRADILNS